MQLRNNQQGKSEGFDICDWPSNLTQIGLKLSIFRPCDLEIWWMTPKNEKARLLSSFVYHFISISEFKLELKSGNAQSGSNQMIFLAVWPCNLTYDLEKEKGTSFILHQALCIISNPSVNLNWSYSRETLNLGQNRQFFVLCDLEIWRMTFKNNRAPLLCYFKLYASFRSHWWIQSGVTVRKRPSWVKINDFF